MADQEPKTIPSQRCEHCGHLVSMCLVASHKRVKLQDHSGRARDIGAFFDLLSCPVCEEVTFRRYDDMTSSEGGTAEGKSRLTAPNSPPVPISSSRRPAFRTSPYSRKIDWLPYEIMLGHLIAIRECNRKKRI